VPDESARHPGAVWAEIRVTTVPVDPKREPGKVEVGIRVCSLSDAGDAMKSWSIELHTEGSVPESLGTCKSHGKGLGSGPAGSPVDAFNADVVFPVAGTLTHIKARCETGRGDRFTKAVRVPEAVAFMPGDQAHVEIDVYMDSTAPELPLPLVQVFQEPPHESVPSRSQPGMAGRIPTRPLGLSF
jgi:hypothetical protein